MSGKYDDIINLPHHTSPRHPRMPISDRAAQFAPFAALVGYDDAVEEVARVTDDMIDQSDEIKESIDRKLRFLYERIDTQPNVAVTYFVPDKRKSGGEYKIFNGRLKGLDDNESAMIFTDGKRIAYDKIYAIDIKHLSGGE